MATDQMNDETVNEHGGSDSQDNGITIHTVDSDYELMMQQESEREESIAGSPDVDEQQEEEQKEEPENKKRKTRAQRTIERLKRENKMLREGQGQGATKASEPEKADGEDIHLDIDDFATYEDYLEAVEAKANQEEEQNEGGSEEPEEVDYELGYRIGDMMEDGAEDYENFEELVSAPDLVITDGMLSDILDLDSPSDVAYYLATHKQESAKIAGMTRREQTKAILKIEIALENKPKKTVRTTSAPEPIKPVGGNAAAAKSINDPGLSFEDYERILNSRKAASRGGFL